MSGPHVVDVDEKTFQERVVEASKTTPVVVDFWAGWCQPCLVLGPVLERLAGEHGGRFTLAKVDVDANPQLSATFGIQGIPAVKAFKDGRVADEFVGAQPEEVVRRFIDGLVPSETDELAAAASSMDPDQAEEAYRSVLEGRPGHPVASAGLASVLLRRGEIEEARRVVASADPSPEVAGVAAQLELQDAAREGGELGAAARAALSGQHRDALERALTALTDGERDRARELIVRLFELLGADHPLTREFRPRLASALY
jgi:putative thioredoxin